jgi:3-dehydroquinate synthase
MLKFWLSFFLFVLAVPLIPFGIFGELPGQSWVEHPSSIYVFFVGIVVLGSDVFLPIPSSLIAVFLGARLGIGLGSLAIMLGLMLGSLIGYYTGLYFGFPLVNKYVSVKERELIGKLGNKYSYLALAMLRAVPVLAEASVLAAGAARLKFRPVLLTLVLANLCLALLYAAFGTLSQHSSSPAFLFWSGVILPASGILILYFTNYSGFRLSEKVSKLIRRLPPR